MEEDYQGVKILFRFYSDILEESMIEILWAVAVDNSMGLYKLDSIPFYVPAVAIGDIVYAEYDETEEMLRYRETSEPSGNSTIWVVITNASIDVNKIRDILNDLDCTSEALSDRYFAVDVPATTNYLLVKDKLKELKMNGILDYAEPCWSAQHQY